MDQTCLSDPSNVGLAWLLDPRCLTPSLECVDVMVNQIQNKVSLACFLDPNKHGSDMFTYYCCCCCCKYYYFIIINIINIIIKKIKKMLLLLKKTIKDFS
jgi:hypothetical protein